uniref:Uncharacterized protein n=2 Tax=Fagus sylvatica TaxID=28930 RepID=A0A2N9IHN5_FAGSY
MPIQRRTINIGSVLGTLAPEPSETSNVPLASGFSEGESVMKKRKKLKGGQIADAVGSALLLPKDMKSWKGNNSTQMIENLKRDSVVVVQGIFEAGYRLVETERLLNESLVENDRLREVEKTASARIREVESQHKTAEEGLQTAECQLVEISAKLERECERSCGFQAEIDKLRAELAEARRVSSNAENAAQAFYDRGFEEAAGSLRLQLRTPENLEETNVEVLEDCEAVDDPTALETAEVFDHQERVQTEEVQDVEKGISDKEDNQIAPNRHIIPFIWSSQPPSLKDVLEISIKVSMYTNNRTSREFVATENLEETNVEVLEDCEAVDDPTALETAEVFDHQERVQTEEVQDVEKGISDKEDNVNVDD